MVIHLLLYNNTNQPVKVMATPVDNGPVAEE
jgi:hypothetical protein